MPALLILPLSSAVLGRTLNSAPGDAQGSS